MYVIGLKSSSETLVFVCFSVIFFFFPFCPLVSSLLECYFLGNGRGLSECQMILKPCSRRVGICTYGFCCILILRAACPYNFFLYGTYDILLLSVDCG